MAGKYLDDEDRFEALIEVMDYTTLFDNTHVLDRPVLMVLQPKRRQ